MQRWIGVVAMMCSAVLGSVAAAAAQTLVPGGLTALPAVQAGPNRLQNGGFESLNGNVPAGWNAPAGWSVDQTVKRSGTFSARRSGGAGSASQTIQLRKGTYTLSGWVRTQGIGSGTAGIRLMFDLRPSLTSWTTTEVIKGTADWKLYEVKNVVVPHDLTATIRLENYGGATGTAWFDDVKVVEQLPAAVDVFLLYPNYRGILFDDQSHTMRFDVSVTPPGGDFARYIVRGTLRDETNNAVVITRDYPAQAHFVAEMDGGVMQMGRGYLATFALVDRSGGAPVYTYPAYRVSRAPGSARQSMNIAFDEKNRITVRGKPRFMLGAYDSGGGFSTSDSFWEQQLWSPTGERRMDGLRINFYLNYWMGQSGADAMKALMSNLQKRGVMYLQTGNCFSGFPAGNNFLIHSSDAYVRDIGAHPGSAGYYTADECNSVLAPGVFEQYKRLRTLDPDSLTFAALFGHPDIVMWRDAADVLASDPYPMYADEPAGGYNHKEVAEWTARTREAVKGARPIVTVLQFFKFTSRGRWPTRQEMRNHATMAIVEGARGLWWWSLGNGAGALAALCPTWCAERTAHMNDLKAVVGELADLEPALLADDAPGALRTSSNPGAIKTRVKVHGGRGYLFAYNNTNQPATATFTWNAAAGSVTVVGENRTVSASGASFTDSFGPYGAHIYVIGNGGTPGPDPGPDPGGEQPPQGAFSVSFTNPASGATVSGTRTVTLSASGGTGALTYTVTLDGTTIYSGANNGFSWNTTTVGNGAHVLRATVRDSSTPARTATAQATVTVNNTTTTPPAQGSLRVFVTSPKGNAVVRGAVAVNVWVEGQASGTSTFSLNAGGQTLQRTATGGHVTFVWDSAQVADGPVTLGAVVRDATGKTGTASVSVVAQNGNASAPGPGPLSLRVSSPAAGAAVSGLVTVVLAATNLASGAATWTLNGGAAPQTVTSAAGSVSVSWDSRAVADGARTLTATVRDAAGRTASASVAVVVRNTAGNPPPPTGALRVFLTSPSSGATVRGAVAVNVWIEGQRAGTSTFTFMVNNRVMDVRTSGGNHVTFVWPTTDTANGSHTVAAVVRDASGQTATVSRVVAVGN